MRFLAEILGVKKNTVYLDKGSKSRHKVAMVQCKEMELGEVLDRLRNDI